MCWAQSALPGPLGPRFSSRASHCYSLPVTTLYASCNLPIWQALPLLWLQSRGEGGSELSKWGEGLKPAKQIRKWALRMFPLGVVRLVRAKACLFSLTAVWSLSLVGGDLFSWTLPQAARVLWGLQDHLLLGTAHPEDGCPTGRQTQETFNSAVNRAEPCGPKIHYYPLCQFVRGREVIALHLLAWRCGCHGYGWSDERS